MRYKKTVSGKFIKRPNRFIAEVEISGERVLSHVKNTGRLRELLKEGATVYLEDFEGRMGTRKMRYSLIGADKEMSGETRHVNCDSQAPNKVAGEAFSSGYLIPDGMDRLTLIRPETVYGDSRFDFYLEDISGNRAFVEVKGVTLEHDGHASFPDAPTERGTKHIRELIRACEEGYRAYILFVIQMKGISDLSPNDDHDPAFSEALREAAKKGVGVMAYDCIADVDSLDIDERVKVLL